MTPARFHDAVAALAAHPFGHPRHFAIFGMITEVGAVRHVALALFGWLP